MSGLTYERHFEPKCHICQFIKDNAEMGQLLEAWLLDHNHSDDFVCHYFNTRYGIDEHGNVNPNWKHLYNKKLKTHRDRHIKDHQAVYARAAQRGLTGNVTLEKTIMDTIIGNDALLELGRAAIAQGSIKIESLGDYIRLAEFQHKMLGGEKVEFNIGGGGGINIPPDLLTAIVRVMARFVPSQQRIDFRKALDAEVFPLFKQYATNYEDVTHRKFDQQAITADAESTATEIVDVEVEDDNPEENQNGHR